MEGAAFLFACLSEKIPCAQIRSISNYIEKRDKSRWNVKLALDNLNKSLMEIIREISN
jgi:futalosine hydrolase